MCILAGAGSGKTTTITRRIAWQVASGAFDAGEILAVTFTDKAAGVMRERLARLGAGGVEARTFHAAALAHLHRYAPGSVGRILPTKALLLRQIANSLPPPYKFRPAGDLATEVERAKARRVRPEEYVASLGGARAADPGEPDVHGLPRIRAAQGPARRDRLRGRARARGAAVRDATSRLAQRCERGTAPSRSTSTRTSTCSSRRCSTCGSAPRDDLCVVGDDYQSIYGFTGASPEWLLGVAGRFPNAAVVRLEENFRSSPQVLELANRLVPRLGGAEKVLRATRPDGPEPELRPFASAEAEDRWLAEQLRALEADGVRLEDTAILCRTNARLADFEEVLHEAGLPFQGSSLLGREAARRLLRVLERENASGVGRRVRELALDAGWLEVLPEKVGERELTRQADLGRLVKLAAELDDGALTCAGFAAELRRRFDPGGAGARGVHLLTYHRAKGLEFEAVFLPRLEDKELPSRLARSPEEQAEERRLLYVGITRAKRRLAITWSRRPSPFLVGARCLDRARRRRPRARAERAPRNESPAAESLRRWRLERARADEVPPYVIFPDRTIDELLARRPANVAELAAIHGLGPARLSRFGDELIGVLARAVEDDGGGDASACAAVRRVAPPPSQRRAQRPGGADADMYDRSGHMAPPASVR